MKILLQNCLLHKICKIKSTVALHYLFVKIFKFNLSNGTGQVRRPHVLQLGLYSSDLIHTCGVVLDNCRQRNTGIELFIGDSRDKQTS